jgi:hypothetical protein
MDLTFVETELWQKHRCLYDVEAKTLTFIPEKYFNKFLEVSVGNECWYFVNVLIIIS